MIRRLPAQSAVIFAVLLPFIAALLLTSLEIGERYLELARVEDAVRQAARSAVQRFDYGAFAANTIRPAGQEEGLRVGCANAPATGVRAIGCALLITNLTGLRGLQAPPSAIAETARWQLYPDGGTCVFAGGAPVQAPTPMVCLSLTPSLTGLLGWGIWSPRIDAAETVETGADVSQSR